MDELPPSPGVIETARIAANITLDKLAEQSGIPRTTLQRLLAEEDNFKVRDLRKLAPILNGNLAEWVEALSNKAKAA